MTHWPTDERTNHFLCERDTQNWKEQKKIHFNFSSSRSFLQLCSLRHEKGEFHNYSLSLVSIESSFAGISHEEHIFVIGHFMLKRAKRPGIFFTMAEEMADRFFACTSKFPAPKVVKIFWGPKVVLTKTFAFNDFLERQCKVTQSVSTIGSIYRNERT